MVSIHRNGWTACTGLSGRLAPKSLIVIARIHATLDIHQECAFGTGRIIWLMTDASYDIAIDLANR